MTERDRLIETYQWLVPLTLKRAVPRIPNRIDAGDLLGVGYVGLVQAADRWDPARGVQFPSFAIHKIRMAFLELLRTEDWAPRSVRDKEKAGLPVVIYEVLSLDDPALSGAEDSPSLLEQLADPSGEMEGVPTKLEAAVVARLVECLPRRLRHVVRRHYWDEETFKQISYQLDRSESRVHQMHEEALFLLKMQLTRWRPETYAQP